MRVRDSICLLVGATLFFTGCSASPAVRAHIDTVNAQKRMLEDKVYELEYDLQVAYDELNRLEGKADDQGTGGNLREDRAPAKKNSTPSKKPSSSQPDLPDLEPPTIDSGKKTSASPKRDMKLDFEEPQIDLGESTKKSSTPAVPETPRGSSAPPTSRFETPPFSPPRGASLPQPPPTFDSARSETPVNTSADERVTQLYLNPFLTASSDFDNKPGDDGLTVVIEPRNAINEFVPQAGPISVVLLDPSKEGEAARVARWDFDTVDASRFLKKNNKGIGLHLQMTWPGSIPQNSRLRLFVRYETVDHRFVQAEQEIFVTLPGQLSQRWTPKTKRTPTTPPAPSLAIAETPLPVVVPATHMTEIADAPPETSAIEAPAAVVPVRKEQSATSPRPAWKPQR